MSKPLSYRTTGYRLIEHHIERHYEIESDKSIYLQRIALEEEFFDDRLDHCLEIPDFDEANDWLMDGFGVDDMLDDFDYLSYSTFNSFFRAVPVDIPRCFKKTYSVRRPIAEIDTLKLTNYLMRHGLRNRSSNLVARAFSDLSADF